MKYHDLSVYDPNDSGPQRFGPRKLFKGGGGSSTTTQSIPDELKPLATAYTAKATNLGNQGYTPYTGQRFAGLNSAQGSAINMIADRARSGSPEMNAASNNLTQTLNGGYLSEGNPYLQAQIDKASQDVTRNYQAATNNTDATFARSGAFGGSAWQQAQENNQRQLAQGLGDVASGMRFQNYGMERGNQMQALNLAPTYGNQAYQDAYQLMRAGQVLQDQQQQGLDFNYQQFQEQQNLPYKQLAAMSGVFGSNLGSTSTTQQSGGGK